MKCLCRVETDGRDSKWNECEWKTLNDLDTRMNEYRRYRLDMCVKA